MAWRIFGTMNILSRRLAAFALDAGLVGASAWVLEPSATAATNPMIAWPIAALPAIGLLGGLAGRFGATPGKQLLGLKLVHGSQTRIGVGRGLMREAIRFLSLPILVLPILYLATMGTKGRTPYDEFLGLDVREA